MYGIGLAAPPEKILEAFSASALDTYQQLSSEHTKRVDALLRAVLYWTAVPLLTTFTAMQVGQYIVAATSATQFPVAIVAIMWGALGVLFIGHLWVRWWLPRRIECLSEAEDTASVDG